MNESSLSQQLREALNKLGDPKRKDFVKESLELELADILDMTDRLLTEHEALQRKADANNDAVEELFKKLQYEFYDSEFLERVINEYREATKPSDV